MRWLSASYTFLKNSLLQKPMKQSHPVYLTISSTAFPVGHPSPRTNCWNSYEIMTEPSFMNNFNSKNHNFQSKWAPSEIINFHSSFTEEEGMLGGVNGLFKDTWLAYGKTRLLIFLDPYFPSLSLNSICTIAILSPGLGILSRYLPRFPKVWLQTHKLQAFVSCDNCKMALPKWSGKFGNHSRPLVWRLWR